MTPRRVAAAALAAALLIAPGCSKPAASRRAARPATDQPGPAGRERPRELQPIPPGVERFSLEGAYVAAGPDAPAAVAVQGSPLALTGQFLPLDSEGRLVGGESVEAQADQVLENLGQALRAAGSDLGRLVQLNVYAAAPEAGRTLLDRLATRIPPASRPAATIAITRLPHPQARVAADAVAAADGMEGVTIALTRCRAIAGHEDFADVAVIGVGGAAYLPAQPTAGRSALAAGDALRTLLSLAGQIQRSRTDVARIRVLLRRPEDAAAARAQIAQEYEDLAPPVSFLEGPAASSVEMDLVLALPPQKWRGTELVRRHAPRGQAGGPAFRYAALVQSRRQIFVSALAARQPGGPAAQVRDVLEQLDSLVNAAGGDASLLAHTTRFVLQADAGELAKAFDQLASRQAAAATTAVSSRLAAPDRSLLLDAVAAAAEKPD